MARDNRSDAGKVKVRVIEFEMEGSNQTLRDSIQNIVGAIGRGPNVAPRGGAPALPARPDGRGNPTLERSSTTVDGEEAEFLSAEDNESPASEARAPAKPRTFKSPEILEIDLTGGEKPLKTFIQEVSPSSVTLRYTAIAYWFKTFRKIEEVTADHIHTAYRHLGWQTPNDASKPLRQLKARPYNYLGKGASRGSYAINHIGENKILELVGKAGDSGA